VRYGAAGLELALPEGWEYEITSDSLVLRGDDMTWVIIPQAFGVEYTQENINMLGGLIMTEVIQSEMQMIDGPQIILSSGEQYLSAIGDITYYNEPGLAWYFLIPNSSLDISFVVLGSGVYLNDHAQVINDLIVSFEFYPPE